MAKSRQFRNLQWGEGKKLISVFFSEKNSNFPTLSTKGPIAIWGRGHPEQENIKEDLGLKKKNKELNHNFWKNTKWTRSPNPFSECFNIYFEGPCPDSVLKCLVMFLQHHKEYIAIVQEYQWFNRNGSTPGGQNILHEIYQLYLWKKNILNSNIHFYVYSLAILCLDLEYLQNCAKRKWT